MEFYKNGGYMLKKLFITSFLLLFLVAANAQEMPAPHVDVFEISGFKPYVFEATYPAKVKAYNVATVVAKVSGTILNQSFKEGEFVEKGAPLFKIDDEIYKSDVEIIKSQLDVAKVQLEKAKADFERVSQSFKENVVSKQDFDNAKFALEQAKSNIALINSQLKKAQINLDYTNILATEKGYLGLKMVNIGDFVTPGTPVVTITDSTKVYVEFSLPDKDFSNLKNDLGDFSNVNLTLSGFENLNGKITFVDSKVDEATSTVKFRGLIDNKDKLLTPGIFVRVNFKSVTSKNLVKIPQKAVLQNPMGTICFVVENDVVGVRPLQIIESKDDFYFVQGPFKPNDKVITNNFFKVKPGTKVVIDKVIKEVN
ncbi:MAG: rane fusion protein multidrug efflux system [Deferribacteres bacterium]|jgi:membrane fusion protein (multidrug efflux system)|nr:rane fusion protein multidrug efflux system [Deferribacteres bacterium]